MKTTPVLLAAMLLAMPVFVFAQVFNGNLTLSTQAEVDAFNYTEVEGSLIIGNPEDGAPSTDITSLQPLSSLTKVSDLIISNNDSLQNLQGLENISSVGYLSIDNNDQLQDLQGLENLSSVNYLKIISNGQLQHLQGLENLTSIGLGLAITHNNQLQDLEGLDNLSRISLEANSSHAQGQDLQRLANPSDISDKNMQENAPFQQAGITEDDLIFGLFITNNDLLKNLKGLDKLKEIDVDESQIRIAQNASLTSLQGLENLTSISGAEFVWITENPSLTSLQGLNNLTHISEELQISNNPSLVSLEGLDNISSVNELGIGNNDQLQDLKGLENLTSVEGISIVNNDQLENLDGLDNISSISDLSIADNSKLTSFNNLKDITELSSLTISNNDQLQDLQGLENLSRVGLLNIINNDLLKNLQGLENLTLAHNRVVIDNNDQLQDLQGLENLTTINPHLQITDNSALVSLQALENLQSLRSLSIERNPSLNDCCAIADIVSKANPSLISIENNGSNCNSVEAIQENCPPVITRFFLIDAVTDQDILTINIDEVIGPDVVINTSETGMHLNIRANAAGQVGSVVFELDGVIVRKENVAPYALFGDEPTGDYHSGMFALGRHTLTATPYDGKNGKGQAGEPLTLEFVVIDQPLAVISFFLVTTDNNQVQYELKDGSTISLQQFDHTKLNILANTFPSFVGSVVFSLSKKKVKKFRTENVYPYLLAGDNPPGNYNDYTFTPGTYHLTATPYPMPKGQGEAGNPLSITFEVVENEGDQMVAARTIPATSSKTKVVETEDLSVELHAEQIWIYPNPSDGMLSIKLPDTAQAVNLYLYNAQGHQVMETTGGNKEVVLDVRHLAAGMYLLKAASGNVTETHRILVK